MSAMFKAVADADVDGMDPEVAGLVRSLARLPGVEGILLGGSRATGRFQEGSDWDFYVYSKAEIPPDARRQALEGLFKTLELDNRYWETEDDGFLMSGTPVDIVYRNSAWMRDALEARLLRYQADTGFSTCLWASVRDARVLFDAAGAMAELKRLAARPYPEGLARNIISKNLPLLRSGIPAYRAQIEKALERGDMVSVNHRLAAFLASWFDILFALNRVPHPGEKRLMAIAGGLCRKTPPGWEAQMAAALSLAASGSRDLLNRMDELSAGMEALARELLLDFS